MSEQVRQMFSNIASKYDAANRLMSMRTDVGWRKAAVRSVLRSGPEHILDLCAGTLDLTAAILAEDPQVKITACDFALPMLREGVYKISGKRANIICGDGHKLPFADASFDAIICGFGIRNLENRKLAAREIKRVLKPGGYLVVLEFFKPNNAISRVFYQTYGRYLLPTIGGLISNNYSAYKYLFESIQEFLTLKDYGELLQEVGFKITDSRSLTGGIAHLLEAESL